MSNDWQPEDDTPFADANGVLAFSVTCGWTMDEDKKPDDESVGDPIVAVVLACITPEDREAHRVIHSPEELTDFQFMFHTHGLADFVAAIVAAGMKVDPSFMNSVVGCLVSQGVQSIHAQVEALEREVNAPDERG